MDSSQDRNLPATARKLQKARQDGQGARSKDLSHLAVLGAGACALLALAPTGIDTLQRALVRQLSFDAATVHATGTMLERMQAMAFTGLAVCGLFALLVSAVAVAAAVFSGGWIWSFKPVTPDFSKLNPLAGIANLFSKQQLANIAKLVLMTVVLSVVAWLFVDRSIQRVAMLVLQPSSVALQAVADWLVSGLGLMLLVVFLAAVVDVPIQAFFFKSRLKMSHREVKQEHKESEGSPEIRSRQRQRAREIANRASVANVPRADFVVVNPTHYAVALKYDETTMGAPQVISKGADMLALKIREIAGRHKVPVLESPPLARALYTHAELDQPIPKTLYTAVAQVLAYVYRLKAAMRGEGPMPGEQPQPAVPPELDPHITLPSVARNKLKSKGAEAE
ncbi:EscU/YscU/HrcU family type III secretion system export apparatus switch protein [Xylophilus sp.]|uniref:EscU/YscU/HrcU family type III secretion system export apparatus switch protein n=1 Tax=Xylophilus sp. TaxID=2653893 RepID=UPI0013B5CED0|nr:EscU/YscU/HrcU family type III secretion system export apparatus switch protein [Xylophilus sp.]KAF1047618.1 MAG: Flagellar biosynthetic protein FlhB [Xylophilus sp.]